MFGRSRLAIGVGAGLTIGFLALILIVGTTLWLVERGNSLVAQSAAQRAIRVTEQQRNASLLRWISAGAAVVIVLVVFAVTLTLRQARDEVRAFNLTLEERV